MSRVLNFTVGLKGKLPEEVLLQSGFVKLPKKYECESDCYTATAELGSDGQIHTVRISVHLTEISATTGWKTQFDFLCRNLTVQDMKDCIDFIGEMRGCIC